MKTIINCSLSQCNLCDFSDNETDKQLQNEYYTEEQQITLPVVLPPEC